MAIELTEKQKQSPLYKYYEMDIAPVEPELMQEIMTGEPKKEGGLELENINDLFKDGYLPGEFGLYELKDGGFQIANCTDMPGVTPEMFEWWFAWHGLDPMRYIIWDKDDHYYANSLNREQNLDESLTMRERYIGTTHDVKEGLFDGDNPRPVHLSFVHPEVVGFDKETFDNFDGAIVCTPPPAIMVHFLRRTETGSELRTRFWIGYGIENGKPFKIPDFPSAPNHMIERAILGHNVKEFRHLAKILPSLYNEYKDNFTVDLEN